MVWVTHIEYAGTEYIAYGEGEIQPIYQLSTEPLCHVLVEVMTWPTMAKWIPNAVLRQREMTEEQLVERYGERFIPPEIERNPI